LPFFQRAAAAFLAISERLLGVRAAALALPPFKPPFRPNVAAACLIHLEIVLSFSPVAIATIDFCPFIGIWW